MTNQAGNVRDDGGRRRRLEARANAVRAQLMEGLDALREKKRLLLDPAEEARRHVTAAVLIAGGAAVTLGATAAFVGYRVSTKKERLLRRRIDAWKRLLVRPERAAPPRRSLARTALERSLVAGVSGIVAALGKHYVEQLLSRIGVDASARPVVGQ
jgi:hypothetical protein